MDMNESFPFNSSLSNDESPIVNSVSVIDIAFCVR